MTTLFTHMPGEAILLQEKQRDQPYSPLNRRMSIVVKEKKDSGINVNPVTQPGVASKSDEDLSVSNAAESLSGLSESGEASDRGTTKIAHRAQSSTVTTPTPAHDRY